MADFLKKIADASWFQNFVTIVILAAGVLVGAETYTEFAARNHTIMDFLDKIILTIFVLEVVIKMGAEGRRPWRYFQDPWNVFDFVIVAACFLPVGTQYVMVLRLARLLRVLKLVRALPKLQILVGALLKSIPSMAYVSLLLILLFYVYAVAGTFMFSENDPVHFDTLPLSMLSLFRAVTLEDWTDLMYINMYGCDNYGYDGMMDKCVAPDAFPIGSPFLFVSFVLLGTMIILNLFIGVIMNGMDEARAEAEDREMQESGVEKKGMDYELVELGRDLEAIQNKIARLQRDLATQKE